MAASSTDSVFARLLLAYDCFRRGKLAAEDLRKIAKKYGSKPAKLIADFGKKYAFPIPATVLLTELKRLLQIYDVPGEYIALLPPADVLASVAEYDPQLDPRSDAFDPAAALRADGICTPFPDATPVDNIHMAKYLLPGESVPPSAQRRRLHTGNVEESAVQGGAITKQLKPEVLERIADSLRSSPYEVLLRHFHDQTRIRVLIRNVNSLRGTCEGYLKAFDKHMNLLMTDVKEVYSVPTSVARSSQQAPKKTMTRFLKQLLVRGDNIVLICAAQSRSQAEPTNREPGREK